jgi:hypothetical protein
MLLAPVSRVPMHRRSSAADYDAHDTRGLSKTHLQHVLTAAAINLLRIASWTDGVPLAKTRCSRFAAL